MDNFTHGKIMPVVMEKEIQDSFIDYAMSVITSRAARCARRFEACPSPYSVFDV